MKECDCNCIPNIPLKPCCNYTMPKLKKVYFNPDTKIVEDEHGNIIGTGEFVKGILKITVLDEND